MNPHDHIEDAEFEDFLKGQGDLSRQLQGLPQPSVPEALSAAILARAAADLADGARPGVSANDAVHDGAPAAPPARHYLRRARMPLGLAASVVLALFVVRGLMPQAFAPEVRQAGVIQESPSPAAKMAEVAPPAGEAAAVAATVAAAEPAPPPPPSAASAPVRAAKPAVAMRPAARSAPMADIAAAPAPAMPEAPVLGLEAAEVKALPPKMLSYAGVPSLALRSAPPPAPVPSPSVPAAVFARAPIPAHAALPGPEVMSVSAAMTASAWLARLEGMLRDGQTKEAHAEWLKFRMRYPDTEVPPELQRQLETVN
ncbi:hypothetical protein [Rugamonas aquatica]|uniref:hypothetical protein n=1 Tax=Rugamonas aquatica TaxID=2743357 RepID=UPI00158248C2|nr:hypothetical protein [Rugamonas aquatica]